MLLIAFSVVATPLASSQPTVGDNDAGSGTDAGDFREAALPIEPGTHSGRLVPLEDPLDWYSFPAVQGQGIRVSFLSPSPAGPVQMQAWIQGPSGCSNSEGRDVADATGVWYVEIFATFGATTDYTFQLEVVDQALQNDATSGADSSVCSPTPVDTGTWSATLTSFDIRDAFTFSSAGGEIAIIGVDSAMQPGWFLADPEGLSMTGTETDAGIEYTLTTPGAYSVQVFQFCCDYTLVEYDVRIRVPLDAEEPPVQDDAGSGRDAGDLTATAVPLTPGDHSASFDAEAGDTIDVFGPIAVPAGHALIVTIESLAASQECVELLDEFGQRASGGEASWCDNFGGIGAFVNAGPLFVKATTNACCGEGAVEYVLHVRLEPLPDLVVSIAEETVDSAGLTRTFAVTVANAGLAAGDFRVELEGPVTPLALGAGSPVCFSSLGPGASRVFTFRGAAVGSFVVTAAARAMVAGSNHGAWEADPTDNTADVYSPGPAELPGGRYVPTSCAAEG